jgi:hypothetical protein
MNRKFEIIYNDNGNIIVVGTFNGNANGYTIDQALQIAEVDMDEFATSRNWDGWDFNELSLRIVD